MPQAQDPFELLMSQHRQVEHLFGRIKDTEGEERGQLCHELAKQLRLHMVLEESLVYPLLAEADEEMSEEAEAEHRLAREALEKLAGSDPDEPGLDGLVAMIEAGITHHVTEEETEAFPTMREALDDASITDLMQQITDFLASPAAEEAASGGSPSRRSSTAKGSDTRISGGRSGGSRSGGNDEPSKQELLERAREAGVKGASHMTKSELQEALDR